MFEKTPSYEAAYIGQFPCRDEMLPVALKWAVERARTYDCGITVVAPSKSNFRDGQLARLPASVGRESWKTVRRTEPVVIAAWANAEALDKLDVLPNVKAVLLMPWLEDESLVWRQARQAVDLLDSHRTPATTGPHPVVIAALGTVSAMVNLSTGLTHPSDRRTAIWAFKLLRDAGYTWEPKEVRAWALTNGWRPSGAKDLSDVAAGIRACKALRGGQNPFKSGMVGRWEAEAAGVDVDAG